MKKILLAVGAVLCLSTVALSNPDGGTLRHHGKHHARPDGGMASAKACASAADCKGMLPKNCQVCGDGGQGCAHFACKSGQCETVTCE